MDVDLDVFGLEAPLDCTHAVAAGAPEAAPDEFSLLDTAMQEPTTSDERARVDPSPKADADTRPCRQQQQQQHRHQPRPLPRLTALAYPMSEQQPSFDTIPMPLPVPIPIPFISAAPDLARSGERGADAEKALLEAETAFREVDFSSCTRSEVMDIADQVTKALVQFGALDSAIPRYFKLALLVWTTMTDADALLMRQSLIRAHADVSVRLKALDEFLDAAFRPPQPASQASFIDGSWAYLVECYTRYQVEFEVEKNAIYDGMARLKSSYLRIDGGRPENTVLENVKSRLACDIDYLLCDRIAERSPNYFVCAIFSIALGLTTSNIAIENLIDRELRDELGIVDYAIEFCFKHKPLRAKLKSYHVRMLLASLLVLRSGLSLPRAVHRPAVPIKALMLQVRGRVQPLANSAPALLYRLVVQQVDTTPSRADLVDNLLEKFTELLGDFGNSRSES